MNNFKVFEFNFIYNNNSDFKDLVVSKNIKEAKKYYIDETYCVSLEGFTVKEIKPSELDFIYLCDENEPEPDPEEIEYNEDDYCEGYKITCTLNIYLKDNQFTHIIE